MPRVLGLLVAALAIVLMGSYTSAALAQGSAPSAEAVGGAAEAALQATAEASVPDEEVSRIAHQLNCPICEGYTLRDCPLEVCAQMRNQIRVRLSEGQSEQEIVDYFVSYYGPQALNAPPTRGFYWVAWLVPVAFLVAGVIGVGAWWMGGRSVTGPEAAEGAELETANDGGAEEYEDAFVRLAEEES